MKDEQIYQRIKRNIIKKLYSKGCFGKGHLLIIRLQKGINKRDVIYIKDVLKQLIKEEIVYIKPTKHGLSAYLNMNRLEEIEFIIHEDNGNKNNCNNDCNY